jgi:hypothetical protein
MALKRVVAGLTLALLIATGSTATEYRPDEFLSLDLSRAVLSPMPLGPPAEFAPLAVEAKSDHTSEPAWAREVLKTEPRKVAVEAVHPPHPRRVASLSHKSKSATRTRLAHHRASPLDAQAMDTRIQVWPCRSGGICNWKQ